MCLQAYIPAARIVVPPAGIPNDKLSSPLSSINATVPIIRNDIPDTIYNIKTN